MIVFMMASIEHVGRGWGGLVFVREGQRDGVGFGQVFTLLPRAVLALAHLAELRVAARLGARTAQRPLKRISLAHAATALLSTAGMKFRSCSAARRCHIRTRSSRA